MIELTMNDMWTSTSSFFNHLESTLHPFFTLMFTIIFVYGFYYNSSVSDLSHLKTTQDKKKQNVDVFTQTCHKKLNKKISIKKGEMLFFIHDKPIKRKL